MLATTREREREREREISLISVRPHDKHFLFTLANDATVRAASFQQAAICWQEHCRWFDRKLNEAHPFYLGLFEDAACGYVRFTPCLDDADVMETSIAVHRAYRALGIGTQLLSLACRKLLAENEITSISAWVKRDNASSLRIFEKNGFRQTHNAIIENVEAVHFLYSIRI